MPKAALAKIVAGAPSTPARPIGEVDVESARARQTGVPELDRVLGGGLVPGAVVLLAGEPGVGKSTLLLEVAFRWAARDGTSSPALYVTGEESAGQVRLRAERTGNVHDAMYLAAESDLSAILGHVDAVNPGLLVVDSVQTLSTTAVEGTPGGVTQVRAVTAALVALAKERGLPVVLVGHVTKDGGIAGPRVLEHLVDVVLHFEGDRHSTLRLVRGVKNRFGPADEVGCFELVEDGIRGVADPSGLFLNRRDQGVPGTAVTVAVEGKRPLVGEVQALRVPVGPAHTPACGVRSGLGAGGDGAGGAGAAGRHPAVGPGRVRGDGRRHAHPRAGGGPGTDPGGGFGRPTGVRCRRTWWCWARWAWRGRCAACTA